MPPYAALSLLSLAALAAAPAQARAWSARASDRRCDRGGAAHAGGAAARAEILGATPMSDGDVAGWADAQRDPATGRGTT
jgi:hypothetical protein